MEDEKHTPLPEAAPEAPAPPAPKPPKFIPFDKHQRATVQRANEHFLQVLGTVGSCMGIENARPAPDLSGFFVIEDSPEGQ